MRVRILIFETVLDLVLYLVLDLVEAACFGPCGCAEVDGSITEEEVVLLQSEARAEGKLRQSFSRQLPELGRSLLKRAAFRQAPVATCCDTSCQLFTNRNILT
ncbi:unnamed protein product [Amoebophrya sp. A120]|nr:unnamed protein product [Amoebophrya sp. A120]|eukprot:GSA120T00014958001.1